jgi:hypothetical protein
MTAPDPRPYAGPGDLVTAADVAAWLVDYPSNDAAQASIDLVERLDRERRQACRRGCFAMAHEARVWRAAERESCRGETWAAVYRERRTAAVRRALAFRAAARQP